MVVVVSTDCPQLTMLSTFCRTALLSHMTLSFATQLPLEAIHEESVLSSLLYLLSGLPHLSALKFSSLPTSFHPLLFHLCLLHCALHHHNKLAGLPTPSLSLLFSSLSLLHSFPHDHPLPNVVMALHKHTATLYSTCCSGPVLESLVSNCLNLATVVPGGSFTLTLGDYGSLEMVTPASGVRLGNYGNHVMGMMSSPTHKTLR